MTKFEINKSKDDQYYFVFNVGNVQVILQSETYTTKQNCIMWTRFMLSSVIKSINNSSKRYYNEYVK